MKGDTMKRYVLALITILICYFTIANAQGYYSSKTAEDQARATYWKQQGYSFNPNYMTASMMDRKVVDIKRAAYWRSLGYTFNPDYMTASMMDRKVVDVKRAAYWKSLGYSFNPDYMTASMMDRKVVDIKRAAYWKTMGYDFNPDYMSASTMDFTVANKSAKPNIYSPNSSLYPPPVAENGDVRGYDNDADGRIEPTYVRGYYRRDGTYVRSHYRAKPRKK